MLHRTRMWVLGLVAFMMGIPLTERVLAGWGDVAWSSINFGLSIADASAGDS